MERQIIHNICGGEIKQEEGGTLHCKRCQREVREILCHEDEGVQLVAIDDQLAFFTKPVAVAQLPLAFT